MIYLTSTVPVEVVGLSIGVIVQNVEANTRMKHHIGSSQAVSNTVLVRSVSPYMLEIAIRPVRLPTCTGLFYI